MAPTHVLPFSLLCRGSVAIARDGTSFGETKYCFSKLAYTPDNRYHGTDRSRARTSVIWYTCIDIPPGDKAPVLRTVQGPSTYEHSRAPNGLEACER